MGQAEDFYSLNDEIAAEREANSPGQGQYGGAGGSGGQGAYQGSQGRNSGSRGSSNRNSQRSLSGSSGYSVAASTINNDYSAPSVVSADAGYGAPGQTYAGVQPSRRRTGKRAGKRFGK